MDNNLRNLQLKILEIVKYFDKLCRENDIEYYILYGSALGAVRHKGFIPWDDDFDLGMTYENYLKFVDVCKTKLDKKKYFLQTPESEENYYLSFAKLRDITTTLIEDFNKDKDVTYGVCIDIFPFVGVPNNKVKRFLLKINRAFVLSANINVINNKFLYFIFRIILKLVGKKRLIKICSKNCVKYSTNDYNTWSCIFDGDGFEIGLTTKEIMGKPKMVKFEDIKLPIPENYHEYLTHIYGDYMKVPSKKEIKAKEHTRFVLDLNHSYQEYLELNKKG